MIGKIILLFGVFLFLVFADTLSIPVYEYAVIRGNVRGREVSRVLLRFDLRVLEGKEIFYGEIIIPNFLDSSYLTLEGWRLTTNWQRNNVNWNSFRRPGGDYDTTFKTNFIMTAHNEDYGYLDITRYLRYWLNNGNNFGILLKRPYYEGDGFLNEINNLRRVLDLIRLKIYYVRR
ncbi:MAG: DNRLRE domain-containing protein [candidate division WOR-3 bacterium]